MKTGPKKDWEVEFNSQVKRLKVKAKLLGEWKKYTKVLIECPHCIHTTTLAAFVKKKHCCRKEARRLQTGRENVGKKSAEKLRGRKDPLETRMKKADGTRRRGAVKQQDDLLYVATRNGTIKVGRCALHRAKRWFQDLELTILEGWELKSVYAFMLEEKIHKHFSNNRVLDPSFGKGWTEVFSVDSQEIVNFVEKELSG